MNCTPKVRHKTFGVQFKSGVVLCKVVVSTLVNKEIIFRLRCLFHRGFQRKVTNNLRTEHILNIGT